jgi:hypothetical protein
MAHCAWVAVVAVGIGNALIADVRFFVAEFTTETRIAGRNASRLGIAYFAPVAELVVVGAVFIIGGIYAPTVHAPIIRAIDGVVAVGVDQTFAARIAGFVTELLVGAGIAR